MKFQKKKLKCETASKGGRLPFWSRYISKVQAEGLNSFKNLERSYKMPLAFRKTLFCRNTLRKRKCPKLDLAQILTRIKWFAVCLDVDFFAVFTRNQHNQEWAELKESGTGCPKRQMCLPWFRVIWGRWMQTHFYRESRNTVFHLRNKVIVFQYDYSQIYSSTEKDSFPPGLTAGLLMLMAYMAFSCWLLWIKAIWLGRNIKIQTDSCSGGENYYHFKCHSAWCMIKGTMRYLLSRQGTDAKGEICSSSLAHCIVCMDACHPASRLPNTPKKPEAFSFNNRRHLSCLGCGLY